MCEIARIAKLVDREDQRFIKKIFTEAEIATCMKRSTRGECFAARWAAKEAFFKALGTGMRDGLKWRDVEVENDELGKPSLKLHDRAAEMAGEYFVHISLTHTSAYAQAFVILEKRSNL